MCARVWVYARVLRACVTNLRLRLLELSSGASHFSKLELAIPGASMGGGACRCTR